MKKQKKSYQLWVTIVTHSEYYSHFDRQWDQPFKKKKFFVRLTSHSQTIYINWHLNSTESHVSFYETGWLVCEMIVYFIWQWSHICPFNWLENLCGGHASIEYLFDIHFVNLTVYHEPSLFIVLRFNIYTITELLTSVARLTLLTHSPNPWYPFYYRWSFSLNGNDFFFRRRRCLF